MKKIRPLLKITAMITALIFIAIGTLSQTVQTTEGKFDLIPPADFVDPSVARGAKVVAELAIPALIRDARRIAEKREALQPEIDKYKTDLSSYDTDLMLYNISLDSYNNNLDSYNVDLDNYESELYPHNTAVGIYDSQPQENRSVAEYNRLIASKNRLDVWLARLDNKKADLDLHLSRVNNHKADLDYDYADLNSRYEYLKYQLNAIDIEMGRAYDQLEMLIVYSEKCNKILKEWSEPVLDTYNLNTQLEKLKAWSNKGWN